MRHWSIIFVGHVSKDCQRACNDQRAWILPGKMCNHCCVAVGLIVLVDYAFWVVRIKPPHYHLVFSILYEYVVAVVKGTIRNQLFQAIYERHPVAFRLWRSAPTTHGLFAAANFSNSSSLLRHTRGQLFVLQGLWEVEGRIVVVPPPFTNCPIVPTHGTLPIQSLFSVFFQVSISVLRVTTGKQSRKLDFVENLPHGSRTGRASELRPLSPP